MGYRAISNAKGITLADGQIKKFPLCKQIMHNSMPLHYFRGFITKPLRTPTIQMHSRLLAQQPIKEKHVNTLLKVALFTASEKHISVFHWGL